MLLGNGDGTFGRKQFAAGAVPYPLRWRYLDGVGGADLAVANSGSVSVLLNNSTGLSAIEHTSVTLTPLDHGRRR